MSGLKKRAEALEERLNVSKPPLVVSIHLSGLDPEGSEVVPVQYYLFGEPPEGFTVETYLAAYAAGRLEQGQRKALKGRVKRKTSKTRRTR